MSLDFIPFKLLKDDTVESLLHEAAGLRTEGWVLKQFHYHGWYKIKHVLTIDAVVTGIKEGEGKYLGLVGALLCSIEDREIASVGGMTDAVRIRTTDRDIGRVVEIAYQCVGANGRLRHPRFVRWRDDKKPEQCVLEQEIALCK